MSSPRKEIGCRVGVAQTWGSGGGQSSHPHLAPHQAVCPWANDSTFLSISFLLCQMKDGLGPLQDLRPGRGCRDEHSPSLPEVTFGAKSPFWFQAPLGLGCPEEGTVLWREAGAAWATFWELPGVGGAQKPQGYEILLSLLESKAPMAGSTRPSSPALQPSSEW